MSSCSLKNRQLSIPSRVYLLLQIIDLVLVESEETFDSNCEILNDLPARMPQPEPRKFLQVQEEGGTLHQLLKYALQ